MIVCVVGRGLFYYTYAGKIMTLHLMHIKPTSAWRTWGLGIIPHVRPSLRCIHHIWYCTQNDLG